MLGILAAVVAATAYGAAAASVSEADW